jgi:hypothetical protein
MLHSTLLVLLLDTMHLLLRLVFSLGIFFIEADFLLSLHVLTCFWCSDLAVRSTSEKLFIYTNILVWSEVDLKFPSYGRHDTLFPLQFLCSKVLVCPHIIWLTLYSFLTLILYSEIWIDWIFWWQPIMAEFIPIWGLHHQLWGKIILHILTKRIALYGTYYISCKRAQGF